MPRRWEQQNRRGEDGPSHEVIDFEILLNSMRPHLAFLCSRHSVQKGWFLSQPFSQPNLRCASLAESVLSAGLRVPRALSVFCIGLSQVLHESCRVPKATALIRCDRAVP